MSSLYVRVHARRVFGQGSARKNSRRDEVWVDDEGLLTGSPREGNRLAHVQGIRERGVSQ